MNVVQRNRHDEFDGLSKLINHQKNRHENLWISFESYIAQISEKDLYHQRLPSFMIKEIRKADLNKEVLRRITKLISQSILRFSHEDRETLSEKVFRSDIDDVLLFHRLKLALKTQNENEVKKCLEFLSNSFGVIFTLNEKNKVTIQIFQSFSFYKDLSLAISKLSKSLDIQIEMSLDFLKITYVQLFLSFLNSIKAHLKSISFYSETTYFSDEILQKSLPYLKNIETLIVKNVIFSEKSVNDFYYLNHLKNFQLENCLRIFQVHGLSSNIHLESLMIKDCRDLVDLSAISVLNNLKKLKIKDCLRLTKIPDMSALTELKELSLEKNIRLNDFMGVSGASNLKSLKISFSAFPLKYPDFSKLQNLEDLNLSGFLNEDLILSIKDLKELINLSINSIEGLKTLPDFAKLNPSEKQSLTNFEALTSLSFLNVLKKLKVLKITSLNHLVEIGDLTGLDHLEVCQFTYCNQLLNIEGIKNLVSLKEIMFCCCKSLEQLSPISNLINLESLELSFLRIKEFPDFSRLTKLESLNLSGNSTLEKLSNIMNLQALRKINLSNLSKIRDFSILGLLKNLKEIDLSENRELVDLTFIEQLSEIEKLDLSRLDELMTLPDFFELKKLKEISFHRCMKLEPEEVGSILIEFLDEDMEFQRENYWSKVYLYFEVLFSKEFKIDFINNSSIIKQGFELFQNIQNYLIEKYDPIFSKELHSYNLLEEFFDILHILKNLIYEGVSIFLINEIQKKDPDGFHNHLIFIELIATICTPSLKENLLMEFQKGVKNQIFLKNWRLLNHELFLWSKENKNKRFGLIPLFLLLPYLENQDPLNDKLYIAFKNRLDLMIDAKKMLFFSELLFSNSLKVYEKSTIRFWLLASLDKGEGLGKREVNHQTYENWILLKLIFDLNLVNSISDFENQQKVDFTYLKKSLKPHLKRLLLQELDLVNIENFHEYMEKLFFKREPFAFFIYYSYLKTKLSMKDYQDLYPLLKMAVEAYVGGFYREMRYFKNEHLKTVFFEREELEFKWKIGSVKFAIDFNFTIDHQFDYDNDWVVEDTDDFQDLLLMGTEVNRSCLKIDGQPILTRALLSNILDGKIRMIAVKDRFGKILGRALVRILHDTVSNEPVLFQESIYLRQINPNIEALLKEGVLKRSQELQLKLLVGISPKAGKSRPQNKIVSYGGKGLEYVDSLASGMLIHPIYSMTEYAVMYEPKKQRLSRR